MGPPGYLGPPEQVRARLASFQLEMVGAFLPQHFSRADRVESDRSWLVANLRALRQTAVEGSRPFAVLCEAIDEPVRVAWAGRTTSNPDARLDDAGWATLIDNLHAAAEVCLEHGLEPVFHPHAGTYVETAAEIDMLASRIRPDLVGLCLDTGHFCFGGADPAACIRDYAELIRHVHVKDCRLDVRDDVASRGGDLVEAVRKGVFCALGTGNARIDESVAALREVGYRGWAVVEQDQLLTHEMKPASVVAGQRANLDYLRARGL